MKRHRTPKRSLGKKGRGDDAVTEFFTYMDIKLSLSREDLDKINQELDGERKRAPLRSSLNAY
jgi:hypothetical protein